MPGKVDKLRAKLTPEEKKRLRVIGNSIYLHAMTPLIGPLPTRRGAYIVLRKLQK